MNMDRRHLAQLSTIVKSVYHKAAAGPMGIGHRIGAHTFRKVAKWVELG